MNLYINGDSFTQRSVDTEHDYSWPAQVNILRPEYNIVNQATGGGSNSRAFSNLVSYYQSGNPVDLVIIGLTVPSRWHVPTALEGSWVLGGGALNDRTGDSSDKVYEWYNKKCYEEVEYTYQYYNTIWQIDEFCQNYLKCPVLFVNMWDNGIVEFDQLMIDRNTTKITDWVHQRTLDHKCQSTLNYIEKFKMLSSFRSKWNMPNQCFINMLDIKHLKNDHPTDRGHYVYAKEILKLVDNIL